MPHLPPAGSGTIALATPEPVALGDQISFDTTGTDGIQYPWIYVTAYQDGTLVYGERRNQPIDEPFKLGAGSSDWVNHGGGPADCRAELFYTLSANGNNDWNGHGDQGPNVLLAECEFHAEG